ncbi:MAG: hypothetical protein RIB93_24010 [Coleofasciculus sp. D1-CHI-01]|uniref:hypothetical protein n=1 Tax=Coleofasciculus sp. D1-CHI-01 TaxID=3068482 RepID=UPI0032FF5298
MNSNKKLPSVSISDSLYQSLTTYQDKKQLDSLDSAVVEILTQFFQLGEEAKRYATVEQLDTLAEKADRLSQQIAALSQVNANNIPTQPSAIASEVSEDWKDIEDEPDEILYDFLEYQ